MNLYEGIFKTFRSHSIKRCENIFSDIVIEPSYFKATKTFSFLFTLLISII